MAQGSNIRHEQHTMQASEAHIYFSNFRFSQRQEEREEVVRKQIQDALSKTTMVSRKKRDDVALAALLS